MLKVKKFITRMPKVIQMGVQMSSLPLMNSLWNKPTTMTFYHHLVSLSSTLTSKKVQNISDLYNHTIKFDSLIVDHKFETLSTSLELSHPSITSEVLDYPITISDAW